MIKANSLLITVIVSLVISIVCIFLIFVAWFNRSAMIADKFDKQLVRNLFSGIHLLLDDTSAFQEIHTDTLDLFDEGNDSVIIKKEYWGLYNIGNVTALNGSWERNRAFLYGASPPSFMDACIYMADHKRPLSLVGNTILQGNVYLSKAGIKVSFIDQRGFNGTKLLEGVVKQSKLTFPGFSPVRFDYLQQLLKECREPAFAEHNIRNLPDTLDRSFYDSTAFIGLLGLVNLSGIKLRGHIIIASDSCIEVEASSILDNVLLVAPIIKIKSGFSGCVQLIASRSIEVEKNCTLAYPSSLVLIKDTAEEYANTIKIDSESKLSGVLFSYAPDDDILKTMVILKKGVLVEGLVYVSGFIEMNATVHGTVVTDYFLYKSNAIMYENYLADVEISRTKLFPYFVNSPLFTDFTSNKIIQWLQ